MYFEKAIEKSEKAMLSETLNTSEAKRRKFQVLFLRNDPNQGVEVHEVKQVDFFTIQEHLEHGESVFITSRNAQKLKAPKPKTRSSSSLKTKLVTAFYLEPT